MENELITASVSVRGWRWFIDRIECCWGYSAQVQNKSKLERFLNQSMNNSTCPIAKTSSLSCRASEYFEICNIFFLFWPYPKICRIEILRNYLPCWWSSMIINIYNHHQSMQACLGLILVWLSTFTSIINVYKHAWVWY